MELRDALRMLRSEAGMTQTELAAAVNVGYTAESRWENKNTRPNKASSLAILALAKEKCVSSVCLDALTSILLASRADDKEDKELAEEVKRRMKIERNELITSEQLKSVINNLDIAVIGHRIYSASPNDTVVFYHNRRYAEMFGYGEEEFQRKSDENIYFGIPPESYSQYSKLLGRLLNGEIKLEEFVITIRGFKKNGEEIWLEIKGVSLAKFSFGHELFISCRDVTKKVGAERKYAEEVAVRDASLQNMYASFHCDLTSNVVFRQRDIEKVVGLGVAGATADSVFKRLAQVIPQGSQRDVFSAAFSRSRFLDAYVGNDTFGDVKAFNTVARRWLHIYYALVKNPYTGHIEAAVYMYDILYQTFAEKMMRIVADRLFEFIGLIDVQRGTFESYYYGKGVFQNTINGERDYAAACEEKLSLFAEAADYQALREAVSLPTVLKKLEAEKFYYTILRLRDYDGSFKEKKITYAYLDETKTMIAMAQRGVKEEYAR